METYADQADFFNFSFSPLETVFNYFTTHCDFLSISPILPLIVHFAAYCPFCRFTSVSTFLSNSNNYYRLLANFSDFGQMLISTILTYLPVFAIFWRLCRFCQFGRFMETFADSCIFLLISSLPFTHNKLIFKHLTTHCELLSIFGQQFYFPQKYRFINNSIILFNFANFYRCLPNSVVFCQYLPISYPQYFQKKTSLASAEIKSIFQICFEF